MPSTSADTRKKKKSSEDLVFSFAPNRLHIVSEVYVRRFVCLVKLKCEVLTGLSTIEP